MVAVRSYYDRKKTDPKWVAAKKERDKRAYWKNPKKARARRRATYKKHWKAILKGNLRWMKANPQKVRAAKLRGYRKRAAENVKKGLTVKGTRRVSHARRKVLCKKAYAVHLRNLAKKKAADLRKLKKLLGSDPRFKAIKDLFYGSQKK